MAQSVAEATMSRHHAKWLIRGAMLADIRAIRTDGSLADLTRPGPVDAPDLPGDVRRRVGGQEGDHAGDLLRATHAADRDRRLERLDHLPGTASVISVSISPGVTALTVRPRGGSMQA
jgi:hypothetical protein